jgi:hypothetical protein
MATIAVKLSEDEFTDQVIELFQLYGWKVVHFDRARKKNGGWRTPIRGDPGSPDILAAKNGRVIHAELKVGKNKPTVFQKSWLRNLGQNAYLWYPENWNEIVQIASGGRQ